MPSQETFDALWMDFARRAAQLSKDPSTKVGAIIVKDNRQLSVGYNGMPSGVEEVDWIWERPTKYDIVKHAEENAVVNAPFDTRGSTIYITHQPCTRCLGLLINAGINRVVWETPYPMNDDITRIWNHITKGFTGTIEQYCPDFFRHRRGTKKAKRKGSK